MGFKRIKILILIGSYQQFLVSYSNKSDAIITIEKEQMTQRKSEEEFRCIFYNCFATTNRIKMKRSNVNRKPECLQMHAFTQPVVLKLCIMCQCNMFVWCWKVLSDNEIKLNFCRTHNKGETFQSKSVFNSTISHKPQTLFTTFALVRNCAASWWWDALFCCPRTVMTRVRDQLQWVSCQVHENGNVWDEIKVQTPME